MSVYVQQPDGNWENQPEWKAYGFRLWFAMFVHSKGYPIYNLLRKVSPQLAKSFDRLMGKLCAAITQERKTA
jgi:hypothetical protein